MDWGADRKVLLRLYRSLVRSQLDYGSIVYGSAPKSYIQMLEPVQNQALRICLGAYRTSPKESLEVEADELPLALRREKLALQYVLKLKSNPSNPAHSCVFDPKFSDLFKAKPKIVPPLGVRIQEILPLLNVDLDLVATYEFSETPPWTYQDVQVDWRLSEYVKGDTSPDVFLSEFRRIKSDYIGHKFIYTDGSKFDERVGAAAVRLQDDIAGCCRLPDHSSIFTAELRAIDCALHQIQSLHSNNFIIVSDSRSALQALQGDDLQNPMIMSLKEKLHLIRTETDKVIKFMWVPSHTGIKGNEVADTKAKEAATKLHVAPNQTVPYSDFKCLINPFIKKKWQSSWDDQSENKLHAIQPSLGLWPHSVRKSRREELILSRLRIGHSHLTHSYLLKREDQPECVPCQCPLTIKHILIDCLDFADIRQQFYDVPDMKTLFETVSPDNIVAFIKEIGLYYKL